MNRAEIEQLTGQLLAGKIGQSDFVAALHESAAADLGDVTLDLDRRRRCGFPEVVFGEGKSAETVAKIVARLTAEGLPALATRITPEKGQELSRQFSTGVYNAAARTFRLPPAGYSAPPLRGRVAVVTAGTSDLPVAEEARETLHWMGIGVELVGDVGVAGLHRLIAQLPRIVGSDAVVVAAGMEAALPSVVGGLVDCPVIAVPTSVGYGASLGGVAALLGMLNSCAANVTVVNIDAGFKAGYVAGLIAHQKHSASHFSPTL